MELIVSIKKKNICKLNKIKQILGTNVDNVKFHFFKWLVKENLVFESEFYCKGKMSNSSCIKYILNGIIKIGVIQYFLKLCRDESQRISHCMHCNDKCKTYAIISEYEKKTAFSWNGLPIYNFIPSVKLSRINELLIAVDTTHITR